MPLRSEIDIHIDEKGFVFATEYTFRGLTISEAPGGFNCVIRAREKTGMPVYAMTVDEDPTEGITRLYAALCLGNGKILWRQDRFALERQGG